MWIFKVGKFEYIDIWQVLSKKKKKNGKLFGIVIEFEKKKNCWKEMIKAKERNVTTGIKISKSLLEKQWLLESPGKCDRLNHAKS